MGVRIEVSLNGLLGDPRIKVHLSAYPIPGQDEQDAGHMEQLAQVEFENGFIWTAEYHVHNGEVLLEADFNFFRDPTRHGFIMKALMEHSVVFRVLP